MKAVVGLGNPGARYKGTRHNIGFELVEKVRGRLQASDWKTFEGCETATVKVAQDSVLLIKPQQFMNCSGEALQPVVKFYRIALSDLIVCYDELDLKPGVLRLKTGGGAAGHLGVTDMLEQLGGDEFHRLRIGIGHPRDDQPTGGKMAVSDWVLGRPGPDDRQALDQAIERGVSCVERFLAGDVEAAKRALTA